MGVRVWFGPPRRARLTESLPLLTEILSSHTRAPSLLLSFPSVFRVLGGGGSLLPVAQTTSRPTFKERLIGPEETNSTGHLTVRSKQGLFLNPNNNLPQGAGDMKDRR